MDNKIPRSFQRVHHKVEENRKHSDAERLENIEHDILFNSNLLYEVLEKYNKYIDYVENAIEEEKEKREFWRDIRKKLLTAGLYSTMVLVVTAVGFYLKEWFKS